MRVLVVEDEDVSARSIAACLAHISATVDHVSTGEEGLGLAIRYEYDLIILDMVLPDIEGFDVVRRLRASKNSTPILILSGLSRPQAKARGLTLGADDFMTKPFDQTELIARVRAIVRRSRGFSTSKIFFGNLSVDIEQKCVFVNEKKINFTSKEYQIIEIMALRKGMTISKELFLDHLYGGIDEPEIKIIDVFVCKLRKKLAAFGIENLINTSWGRGYYIKEEFQKIDKNETRNFSQNEMAV